MTKAEIIEAIKEMSVLDLADLVNELAEVFGVAEGSTTVTYTVGDEKEVWKITVTAAPAEETPAEEASEAKAE